MELFEYLMVMVAIILGVGATHALRGLSKVARSPSRYPVLTLWGVTLFYLYIQVWWALWDLDVVGDWNQLYFYLVIAIPCAMFGATELLMPLDSKPETDWEAHFYSVRPWFFGAMSIFVVISILLGLVLLNVPLTHPYRVIQGLALMLILIGLFTPNRRAHFWISVIFFTNVLVGQALFRYVPGLEG